MSETTQELIGEWISVNDAVEVTRRRLQEIEFEITTRMEADEALAVPHDTHDVEMVPSGKAEWDMAKLIPLKERVPPAEWDMAFTPAHKEIVDIPDSLDMRIVKTWKKFGRWIADQIEVSAVVKRRKLRIRPKAKGGA